MVSLVDTHAHLDMLDGYTEFYVAQAAENGVDKIIIPSIGAENFSVIVLNRCTFN